MWKEHYSKIKKEKHPPAYTLRKALEFITNQDNITEKTAVDLGCGNGVDTFALLENGFSVVAIDSNPNSLLYLQQNLAPEHSKLLKFNNVSFENIKEFPLAYLVNASFSLPFCHPNQFDNLWSNIIKCISPEGIFCGHFFGPQDSWSSNSDMTFHNIQDVKNLFDKFELLYFNEISKKGKTLSGKEKFWHVFHIVAKKKHPQK
ncbi:methyltransferase domain-containing protein [Tenacibaculum mesophilum]|uniref:methyltransferase domain-containing protein n=1 Tax=Tenacibaculum mesophilum TaxID=104268 RepID=UPI0014322670|nr:methyltransferase domain-containing protein [Tenacibaculum mesophilum]KAF9658021.1 methyltransferase domain-containing protein [Tenacibaculum mesophilum]